MWLEYSNNGIFVGRIYYSNSFIYLNVFESAVITRPKFDTVGYTWNSSDYVTSLLYRDTCKVLKTLLLRYLLVV